MRIELPTATIARSDSHCEFASNRGFERDDAFRDDVEDSEDVEAIVGTRGHDREAGTRKAHDRTGRVQNGRSRGSPRQCAGGRR